MKIKDRKLEGIQFKLGLAIFASMFLEKLNNITPQYLEGAIQNASSEKMQHIAEFFYNLATNPVTSVLFHTPHFQILPEDAYGFTGAFMLINFIITYTPVFFLFFLLIPKLFKRNKKPIKDNKKYPNYYDPDEEQEKTFLYRLKFFLQGVKILFKAAFLE
jgi:hypothetical protein